jgi:Ca2+-binding EF-hand superfamily protein
MTSPSPSFTADEIRHRESVLLQCFQCCDANADGVIDAKELEAVARAFTSSSSTSSSASGSTGMSVEQECRIIFSKLDRNVDGLIDAAEWTSVLFDLFRFMNETAFDKHCEELLAVDQRRRSTAAAAAAQLPAANGERAEQQLIPQLQGQRA